MTVDNTVSYDDMMDNMQNYSPQKSQPLSVEQLLQPRYEVIADYPKSPFRTGQIILSVGKPRIYNSEDSELLTDYPHIFKPLEWWQRREVSDMPEYVRYGDWDKPHSIYKIKSYNPVGFENYFDKGSIGCAIAEFPKDYFLPTLSNSHPATKEEHDIFLEQRKNQHQ